MAHEQQEMTVDEGHAPVQVADYHSGAALPILATRLIGHLIANGSM